MKTTSLLIATAGCALLTSGCASSSGTSQGADTATTATPPAAESAEQKALRQVFENIFEVPAEAQIPDNLLAPKTVQDAQDIVRSDNVALFARADAIFVQHLESKPQDLENLTWHAQLYLAWADGAALTRKTLATSVERLEKKQAKLQAKLEEGTSGLAKQEAEAELQELAWLLPLTAKVVADLDRVTQDKLAIGKQKTEAIVKTHADTYEGYRLAADYHRQAEAWETYTDVVSKLEKLNPDSNGLRFLRGVVAFARDKDYATAEQHLAEAVQHDAKFTKAQYYLALSLLNQRKLDEAVAAMERTLELSPGHPFANAVKGYVARLRRF